MRCRCGAWTLRGHWKRMVHKSYPGHKYKERSRD